MKNEKHNLKELHLWTDGGTQEADPGALKPYLRWVGKEDRILDIGCGDGRILRFLLQQGYQAEGVDLNPELVALCREQGLPVELGDAAEVIQRDASNFKVFSMLDFIEHIPMEVLLDILGVIALKPGARVWIQTPNLDSVMGFKFWFHMPTHVLPLHPWVLRKILDRLGFAILAEWTDYGGIPWTGFRRWLTMKILMGLFGPPLAQMFVGGGNICLVAEARGTARGALPIASVRP
jgi:2-polyprenyl-3-methyl-5-hydroxy-6-metoxy-1,4-benzoquinol methylase